MAIPPPFAMHVPSINYNNFNFKKRADDFNTSKIQSYMYGRNQSLAYQTSFLLNAFQKFFVKSEKNR